MDNLLEQYVGYINSKKVDSGYAIFLSHYNKCYSVSKTYKNNGGIDILASGMTKNEVHFYLRGLADGLNPLSLGEWK